MSEPTRHRGIASWAINRPIGTIMITSTLLVLGAVYIGRLPVDLLPRIVYPQVRVNVSNAGVEPVVLEETVAKPLESALASTENLERLETSISEGRVSITLDFRHGTNVDFALQDAAKNVERVRAQLPEEADPPTIRKSDPSDSPIYQVAFSSPERDQIALRQWVDQRLSPQLLSVAGVASVDVEGGLVREIQVVIDPERLRGFGLSVASVTSALRAQNQDLAAGRIGSAEFELVGKTAGKFRSVEDIRNVLLTSPNGARIPLSDVATVRDTSAEQRLWARLDGVNAVRIGIRKQPEANTVTAVDGVEAKLEQLRAGGYIPRDIRFVTTFDQSGFIRDAIGSVRDAAIIGALLAMLVVLVFLRSFRKTFIIGVSIPLAILATFVMMGIGDLTLNIMSLGGLALGTGLLLDNAIVMIENIYRRRELDHPDPEDAAHVGAAEVTSAVVASTTTNVASVAPFLLITGLAALIFRELILTISFAIIASLPLALTLVPMLAAQLGKIRFTSGLERFRPLVAFDNGFDRMVLGYRRLAASAVRHRGKVLTLATALLIAAGWAATTIDSTFLPPVDDGSVGAFVRLPPGSTPQQTNRTVEEVEAMMKEMPGVVSVFATAGGFFFGGATSTSSGRGSVDVRLVPAGDRGVTAEEWVVQMREKVEARGIAGANVWVRPPRIRGLRTSSSGDAMTLNLVGDDLGELETIGREIARKLQGIPGLANFDVQTDEPAPLLAIVLDRERARALGLDVATVGQTLRTALDGTIATRYAEGNLEYDVRVMFPRGRFTSASDLGDVALFPGQSGGAPIALREVADVRNAVGPTNIRRENQNRMIRLSGDVLTNIAPVGAVADSIQARLAGIQLPDGYGLVLSGDQEAIEESNKQMLLVVGLAIFLVFVVLAVQYESLVDPLVILVAIPTSMVGVIAILLITGTPFSAPVLLGMIMLAGIVVNNSILLVEFIEHYRHERGVAPEEAVVEAGAVRMRPIMMTTITSLVGMLPLALGLGSGGELMRPLAIAAVGGLTASTLLTLFVVPCAYLVVHRVGDGVREFLLGRKGGPPAATQPVEVGGD